MKEYEQMMIEESIEAWKVFQEMHKDCPSEFMNVVGINIG